MTRPEAMRVCQQMKASEWSVTQIRDYLHGHGVRVCVSTVQEWADPSYAERNRKRRAQAKREKRVLDRIRTLNNYGVPVGSIALVMSADLGVEVSRDHVRYALDTGRLGRSLRKGLS